MFDSINKGKWWDIGLKLVEGCTPISEGCKNCWSLSMEKRFHISNQIKFYSERLVRITTRKKPTAFAIWNDLFHEAIAFEQILQAWDVMCQNPRHNYLILTKRPDRMLEFFKWLGEYAKVAGLDSEPTQSDDPLDYIEVPEFIWIGTTVESQKYIDRIIDLIKIPAKVRFLSCEPLLSDIDFPWVQDVQNTNETILKELKWVIVGPETGSNTRSLNENWVKNIYNQCAVDNTAFFDKRNVLGLNIKQFPYVNK